MKTVLAINGSPRKSGNTSLMLSEFVRGAEMGNSQIEVVKADELHIKNCTGCLRCNIIKKCSVGGDDWADLSQKILGADVLVFASPIYFHHVTAPMKMIIDRFRSFVHVQITETGLIHTPWDQWDKDIVLILPMGSSDDVDANPVIELFQYMCNIFGSKNRLHVIKGTRLGVNKHITKTKEELEVLYPKMKLPIKLAGVDAVKNVELLEECFELGKSLSSFLPVQ